MLFRSLRALISQAPFVNVLPAALETLFDLLTPRLSRLPLLGLALAKDPGFIPLLQTELGRRGGLLSGGDAL